MSPIPHLRRHHRLYLLGLVTLGLIVWLSRPSGWWRVELLIRAQPKMENGWSVVEPYALVGFLDDGRRHLFSPEFFSGMEELSAESVRPLAVEQFRCSSIFDVTVETTRPDLKPAISTYTSRRILSAMRTNYPNMEFEFIDDRLSEKPAPLRRLVDAFAR